MSWNEELHEIYVQNCGRKVEGNDPILLPVAHSTANAQIEITIDKTGTFKDAKTVEKSDAVTIIPATEDSATRSNGICPMPLADKLMYVAGDYLEYVDAKRSGYKEYIDQLGKWCDSEYSHSSVRAVYAFLIKGNVISELIKSGIIETDENGSLKEKVKIAGQAQKDCFVRFIVQDAEIPKTWEDQSLYESFIGFNNSFAGEVQLCYATGKLESATYKHPSKIRNAGDKAKIISSNDESGFTYRGRFANKEQAISVSYEYSQEVHNALRWLIQKQGKRYDSLTLVVWASALSNIPDITESSMDFDDEFPDEEPITSTGEMYMSLLHRRMTSYGEKLEPNAKVMIMGLDAATPGRLSISFYSELEGSRFIENIEKWHAASAWLRFNGKMKTNSIDSFSVADITRCAFGMERGAFIECDKGVLKETLLRLLPCITEGKSVPQDIISALYNKASNPLAYENSYNHRLVVETACGMIRYNMKGAISMGYDPDIKDRSYLYGCLLAIADKAESESYEQDDRNVRVTNARRYWSAFSQRPYQTWIMIEERLQPYFSKLGKKQLKYNKWLNEIMDKFDKDEYTDNSRLEPLYLLGYHHFTSYMFGNGKEE